MIRAVINANLLVLGLLSTTGDEALVLPATRQGPAGPALRVGSNSARVHRGVGAPDASRRWPEGVASDQRRAY